MANDLLTTREAAALLGVGTTSIKRWADSGVLQCVKTPGGHRRFLRASIDALVRSESAQAAVSDSDGEYDDWIAALGVGADVGRAIALLMREREAAGAWWRVAERLGGLVDEIGRRWERGELSVIQEHIASDRLALALAQAGRAVAVPSEAPTCLLAAAEGDDHTLGLSLAEPCLREAGWNTAWAGRVTPVHLICDHIDRGRADMVAMSASQYSRDAPALADQARRLGAACRARRIPLLLGGAGAWPDPPSYGVRLRSFRELVDALASHAAGRVTRLSAHG